MVSGSGTQVTLNQCLFGYDEGHRLLASSQRLPEGVASLLLLHSDLVPGLPSSTFKSYWTGIPLPPLKSYALMHTWPAPEMPRPGCVWTHVILIGFADVARFPALGVLRQLFTPPVNLEQYSSYKEVLLAETIAPSHLEDHLGFSRNGLRILDALYSDDRKGVLSVGEDDLDDVIFAAWSQQWPRLRRSFSFRTARVVSDLALSHVRFDLRLARELFPNSVQAESDTQTSMEPWEQAALDDLLHGPSDFRRFLWRYGSDQRRGRGRFRFLAELYAATQVPTLAAALTSRVLEQVVEALPDPDDGKLLKEDLVSAGQSKYSLFPPIQPLDILDVYASGAARGALPLPPATAFEAVHELWSEQPTRILSIAERAVRQEPAIADQILQQLAAVATPETFLSVSKQHPVVRARLVASNPILLDSPELVAVEEQELDSLLTFVTDPELAGRIVARLITEEVANSSSLLMSRFPDVVEGHVLDSLTRRIIGQGPDVPSCWLDAVHSYSPASLARRLLNRVTTTSALAASATLLRWDLRAGLSASPSLWAETLLQAHDDVIGETRQKLFAYLLALALAKPTRGCEPLFERSFEFIHSDLEASRLSQDAFKVLAGVLPDLLWWEQWDTCLRLQLGTANAYVNAGLDPKSFRRLTRDASLFKRLVQLANRTSQGRHFLKHLGV